MEDGNRHGDFLPQTCIFEYRFNAEVRFCLRKKSVSFYARGRYHTTTEVCIFLLLRCVSLVVLSPTTAPFSFAQN